MEENMNTEQQTETYPVSLTAPIQERYSRWLALGTLLLMVPKMVILIPHWILLYLLTLVSYILGFVAQIVVLFSGKYPPKLHAYILGFLRWRARVMAYAYGLTDQYPPFRLDE